MIILIIILWMNMNMKIFLKKYTRKYLIKKKYLFYYFLSLLVYFFSLIETYYITWYAFIKKTMFVI
jgi:hypothetical protein